MTSMMGGVVRHWQHEDTGRITTALERPGPRWYEVELSETEQFRDAVVDPGKDRARDSRDHIERAKRAPIPLAHLIDKPVWIEWAPSEKEPDWEWYTLIAAEGPWLLVQGRDDPSGRGKYKDGPMAINAAAVICIGEDKTGEGEE